MIFFLVCLAALAVAEFATIAILLAPLSQSTQTDWLIGTLGVAPYTAAAAVWLLMLACKTGAGVVWMCRRGAWMYRWATGRGSRQHPASDSGCVTTAKGIVPATTDQRPGAAQVTRHDYSSRRQGSPDGP